MDDEQSEPWEVYSRKQPPYGFRHPISRSELRAALVEKGAQVGHAGLWLANDPPDEVAGVYWHTDSGSVT